MMTRCRSTLRYDTNWHTRCLRDGDPVHTRHVGNESAELPGQVKRWREGDPSSYELPRTADRDDEHAWEVPPP